MSGVLCPGAALASAITRVNQSHLGPPSAYFSCTRQAFFERHTAFALLVHVPRPALIGGRILRFGPNCWWVQEEYALPRHRLLVAFLCSAWFVFPADAEETFQLFQHLVAASLTLYRLNIAKPPLSNAINAITSLSKTLR